MTDRRLLAAGLLAWGAAAAAEPTLEDLERGTRRAAGIVAACEAQPAGCADPETRAALARALYTLTVDELVTGAAVDRDRLAGVVLLDPRLAALLPEPEAAGRAPEWVVEVASIDTRPARPAPSAAEPPPSRPSAVQRETAPTEGDATGVPDDTAAPTDPALVLFRRVADGDGTARTELLATIERQGFPAAALILRTAWLAEAGGRTDGTLDGTRDAVRLAMVVGSRRPLMELAETLHPSRWHPSVASDGWLALGESWRLRGDLSPALKAFSAIDPTSAAYGRGEYLTGVIYQQTGQPWEALPAFGNAWEAESDDIDGERIREMALWHSARVHEALQRPSEAQARYEVLALERSALSDRAAHGCARVAWSAGQPELARRWLRPTPGPGVFAGEAELLRAQIAHLAGDAGRARTHLDRAEPLLRSEQDALKALTRDPSGLWAALHGAKRDPTVEARLDADPEIAAFRSHLASLASERRAIAAHPAPGWRDTLGRALDRRLEEEQVRVQAQATAAAHAAVIDIQREVGERMRDAARLRTALDD